MSVEVTANNSTTESVCGIRESVVDQSDERMFCVLPAVLLSDRPGFKAQTNVS